MSTSDDMAMRIAALEDQLRDLTIEVARMQLKFVETSSLRQVRPESSASDPLDFLSDDELVSS